MILKSIEHIVGFLCFRSRYILFLFFTFEFYDTKTKNKKKKSDKIQRKSGIEIHETILGDRDVTTVHNVEWDDASEDWKVTYCIAEDIFTRPLAQIPKSLKSQIVNLMPSNRTLAHRVEEVRRAIESDVLLVNHNEPNESD